MLGQPPEVVHLSSQYLKIWSIGSPAFVLYSPLFILICRFESLKRYMQCQGKMQVPTYVLLFCAPMNAVMNYWFIWRTSLGFIGAPTATVITHWTMAVSLVLYAGIYGSKEAWPGWSWHIFEDWKSWKYMIHLAGSGVVMLCSEIWSWEAVILASSFLGVKSLAANSILLVPRHEERVDFQATAGLTIQIPIAVAIAISVRIGHLLGAGQAATARKAARVSAVFSIFIGVGNSLWILIAREKWAALFNHDPDVVAMASRIVFSYLSC